MSQVDFAISMVLILTVLSFSIFYTVNYHTDNIDRMREFSLSEKSESLMNSIEDTMKVKLHMADSVITNTTGDSCSALIQVSMPGVEDVMIYDEDMVQIDYKYESNILTFGARFSDGEKHYYIFYSGESNIDFIDIEGVDIRAVVGDVFVLDEEKCADIDLKEDEIAFASFTAGGCVSGSEPPSGVDVKAINRHVLMKSRDNKLENVIATLRVW